MNFLKSHFGLVEKPAFPWYDRESSVDIHGGHNGTGRKAFIGVECRRIILNL